MSRGINSLIEPDSLCTPLSLSVGVVWSKLRYVLQNTFNYVSRILSNSVGFLKNVWGVELFRLLLLLFFQLFNKFIFTRWWIWLWNRKSFYIKELMTWSIRCYFTFLVDWKVSTNRDRTTTWRSAQVSRGKSRHFGASVDVNVSSAKYQNALGRNNSQENTPGILYQEHKRMKYPHAETPVKLEKRSRNGL